MIGQARDQIKRSIAAEALRSGLHVHLRAMGTSMLPTLWPGDLLTIESIAVEQAEPGDLILYMHKGRFFIHRLIEKHEDDRTFITRGDCMPAADPPVPAKEFLGKVVQVRHGASSFEPHARFSGFHWAIARLLCYIAPLQQLALRSHARKRAAHFDLTLLEEVC
jgi:signal peptidase I